MRDWFKVGLKFRAKWLNKEKNAEWGENLCEILSIDKENNQCRVEIITPPCCKWEENWNLAHTLEGFHKASESFCYKIVPEQTPACESLEAAMTERCH